MSLVSRLKSQKLGASGEARVATMLEKQKFTVVAKNYRQRFGEIDIIAKRDDLTVFVEVKTRKRQYFSLSQVIVPSKQTKILATAKHYMANNDVSGSICRFDVALVTEDQINYIPNAFNESCEEYQN